MTRRVASRAAGRAFAVGLSALALATPAAAAVDGVTALLVDGTTLDGATVSTTATVTVTPAAPRASSVSWVLDGSYLGRDTTPPFQLALHTSPGRHRLKVSTADARDKVTVEARFTAVATPPTPPPSPPPTPPPIPTGADTPWVVRTSAELSSALARVRPGDVVQLADGTYSGRFVATRSGTAAAPIVLRGGRGAVLDGGSTSTGYTLHLDGANHWRLQGFTVRGGQKGIVLDRSRFDVLAGLDVGSTGMEAVHLRGASSDNRLEGSAVHGTGLSAPGYGEGVYVGSAVSSWPAHRTPDRSDRNAVVGNSIWDTTAENIDAKEGTTGGVVADNVLDGAAMRAFHFADSWLDVKGNGYRVSGNRGTNAPLDGFQTHVQRSGWGRENVFTGNLLVVNGSGYGVDVDHPAVTANVVGCDNVVIGAGRGFANVRCTP